MLTEPKSDLVSFLVPDEVGLAVDDFELVFLEANFFDHPELPEIVLVGLRADDPGGLVLLGVVRVDPEGLVAILGDDLVDVSSGEDQGLHNIRFKIISYLSLVSNLY